MNANQTLGKIDGGAPQEKGQENCRQTPLSEFEGSIMTDMHLPARLALKNKPVLRFVLAGGCILVMAAALPLWTIEMFIWVAKI